MSGAEAIKIGMNKLKQSGKLVKIYKTVAYKDQSDNGYVFTTAKGYNSGNRMRYWTSYSDDRLSKISKCKKRALVLCCRNKSDCVVLKLTKEFLESQKAYFSCNTDDDGNINYYNIVVFIDGDEIKLSEPERSYEIDISKYAI